MPPQDSIAETRRGGDAGSARHRSPDAVPILGQYDRRLYVGRPLLLILVEGTCRDIVVDGLGLSVGLRCANPTYKAWPKALRGRSPSASPAPLSDYAALIRPTKPGRRRFAGGRRRRLRPFVGLRCANPTYELPNRRRWRGAFRGQCPVFQWPVPQCSAFNGGLTT
jgi:hypothetical protein